MYTDRVKFRVQNGGGERGLSFISGKDGNQQNVRSIHERKRDLTF